jgi:hypothetical protein
MDETLGDLWCQMLVMRPVMRSDVGLALEVREVTPVEEEGGLKEVCVDL